jgi:hypothetical protein
LNADELSLEIGLAVLKEHGKNFLEVGLELVQSLGLTVCPRKAREVADQKTRIRIPLDQCREATHLASLI